MLKDKDIICISSIDWDFIWQGHQEIMLTLANSGNRVLFIENTGVRMPGIRDFARIRKRIKNWFRGVDGIRKYSDNLYIFSPVLLPFPYSRIILWINRMLMFNILNKWIKVMHFGKPLVWTFLPTPLAIELIERLDPEAVVYYCIDNFRASSAHAKRIEKSEIRLLKKADLVFVTSQELYRYCLQFNHRVYTFPFAVNIEEFQKARLSHGHIPEELKGLKKPIVGYVGGVHKWIDFSLVKELALSKPEYTILFIGPLQTDVTGLLKIKNVCFLGQKAHEEVPYFVRNFDVCIIPYLLTDYTKNVYPTKLNEYLAMGKPVVSTALPEVVNFNKENNNVVLVGKAPNEFIGHISSAIKDDNQDSENRRIACAEENSWSVRVQKMSDIINAQIQNKAKVLIDWKESFLRIYKASQRKILKLAFAALAVYLLVFYTPLFWFIARPLKISDRPQRADAIVVFAGGVGESGEAGQGYEERIAQAVKLYKKGYAENMVFSSGYMYAFKEPLVMKALAVSLGVPEDKITIEDNAKNTYENVKFSYKILQDKKWASIILISSPYHMRRASLVFDRVAPDIKVVYSPVENSLFYAHPARDSSGRYFWRRINTQQIKGILHEYLGIIYYWMKGWV